MSDHTREPEFEKGTTIRTTAKAQRALKRVLAELKGSDRVRWKGGSVSQEAVINASWLYLDDLGADAVEEIMARYLPRLEALMTGREPDPEGADDAPSRVTVANPPSTTTARRQARRA